METASLVTFAFAVICDLNPPNAIFIANMASSGVFSSFSRLKPIVPLRKIRSDFVDEVVPIVDVRVDVSKFVVPPEFQVQFSSISVSMPMSISRKRFQIKMFE